MGVVGWDGGAVWLLVCRFVFAARYPPALTPWGSVRRGCWTRAGVFTKSAIFEKLGPENLRRVNNLKAIRRSVAGILASALVPKKLRMIVPPLCSPLLVFSNDDAEPDTGSPVALLAAFAQLEHLLAKAFPMAFPAFSVGHRPRAVFIFGSLHRFFHRRRGRTNEFLQEFPNLR